MTLVRFDPFAEDKDGEHSDLEQDLKRLGWEAFLRLGEDLSHMQIVTYRKDGEYLISVWDVNQGTDFLHTDSLPEFLDAMARWAPLVQAAAVVGVLGEISSEDVYYRGFAERLGAKLAFGRDQGLGNLLGDQQREREAFEKRRAAKKQQGATQSD